MEKILSFSTVEVHFVILLFVLVTVHGIPDPDEPICMSRYDYEHKMLHSMVKMEIEQTALQERIEKLKEKLENENTFLNEKMQKLEEIIVKQESAIKTITAGNQKIQKNLTHCTEQCKPRDGMAYEGYTFKDYLAQATCMALGVRHVYAVRRTCSSSYPDCSNVCKTLGRTCINSLHVYNRDYRGVMTTTDVGKEGLLMYRYNHCGGGCGPNFCCCQG